MQDFLAWAENVNEGIIAVLPAKHVESDVSGHSATWTCNEKRVVATPNEEGGVTLAPFIGGEKKNVSMDHPAVVAMIAGWLSG